MQWGCRVIFFKDACWLIAKVMNGGFTKQLDHFRIVFLPHEQDLREAISRIATFLENYRNKRIPL